MDKQTFLTRFLLHNPLSGSSGDGSSPALINQQELKKAAVLIPLVKRQNGLNIIFTERALALRHHPGQVSFPGGKHEQSDPNLLYTAVRETQEEIGIFPEQIVVFGRLAKLTTVSGFIVTPYLGFVESDHSIVIDPQEVKTVFEVPLAFLLNKKNTYLRHLIANKKRHFSYCIPYRNRFIWGATAQMLVNLQHHLDD
ncbi:CoA pyrophosphatase [Psychromonas antarctica]|jgi:8-oxo-dGTP pyrophosphatase MutT (NUDIX family)|uniref:CoA pyrophosphatase n=1 Tax=Psychromonas antarctica TaxID=67573 RepID=UPI001EE8D2F2|nr:CoA pyrophosphatase [Psychromonas antarctica]MCG6201378.1 CoA pyrophosphatase [Psychromonas antarctica]